MSNNIVMNTCDDFDVCNMDDDELFELMETIDYEKECDELEKLEMNNPKNNTQMIQFRNNKNINKTDAIFCRRCNSNANIVEENACGIMVCYTCGSVLSTIYDQTIEQKLYNDDSKGTLERCSGITNPFLVQTSLSTTISGSPTNRLKKLQQWSAMPYKERSLYNVLKTIQTKCRENNILKCIEDDAKILYKNISESKHETGLSKGKVVIKRGPNREALIAACVFYACKRKGKSRGPKEIATIFNLEYTDLTKGCKIFKDLMKMKYLPYDSQVVKPEHFILDYCKVLSMNKTIIEQAMTISVNIQKLNVASMHTPVSIAIGSILVTMKHNNYPINKNNIAKKFKVSAVTVSKAQKQITKYGTLLLNDQLVDKITKISEEEKKNIKIPFKFQLMHDKIINKREELSLEYLRKDNNLDNYISSILNESKKDVETTTKLYIEFLSQN